MIFQSHFNNPKSLKSKSFRKPDFEFCPNIKFLKASGYLYKYSRQIFGMDTVLKITKANTVYIWGCICK